MSLLQNGLDKSSQTSQNEVISSVSSDESALKAPKLAGDRWRHQKMGQGILLVTEHNAEINAGFIVAFASSHAPPVEEDRWRLISDTPHPLQSLTMVQQEAERLEQLYWAHVMEFLGSRRPVNDMNAQECAAWVQSGLALAPFAGWVTKRTCDWTIAWSLIGEWTCREIFLPPAGAWPRNGRPQRLLDDYAWRGTFSEMHSFVCCQEIECSKLSEFFRVVLVLSFCMDMAVPRETSQGPYLLSLSLVKVGCHLHRP